MHDLFDPSRQFELEGVDDDISFYKFITRKRAEAEAGNLTVGDRRTLVQTEEDIIEKE